MRHPIDGLRQLMYNGSAEDVGLDVDVLMIYPELAL